MEKEFCRKQWTTGTAFHFSEHLHFKSHFDWRYNLQIWIKHTLL